jgi:hypothetical protein
MPPLSQEQLTAEFLKWTEHITTVENPSVLFELNFSFAYLRHAMIKIAYELAFLWLGESYLDDQSAADLRAAIREPNPASTDHLDAYVGDADACDAFKPWSADKTHHLAYSTVPGDHGIAIAVRVFDIYAAVVSVTKDAARYLAGSDARTKLRFLSIEPVSGDSQYAFHGRDALSTATIEGTSASFKRLRRARRVVEDHAEVGKGRKGVAKPHRPCLAHTARTCSSVANSPRAAAAFEAAIAGATCGGARDISPAAAGELPEPAERAALPAKRRAGSVRYAPKRRQRWCSSAGWRSCRGFEPIRRRDRGFESGFPPAGSRNLSLLRPVNRRNYLRPPEIGGKDGSHLG